MSGISSAVDPRLAALSAAASAALAAVLVLVLAARPWRGRAEPLRTSGAPLALALGTMVGFWRTRGLPSLPPGEMVHWLFYAALLGGIYGALEPARPSRVRWMRALLAALLPVVMLAAQRRSWSPGEGIAWTAGLALLLFAAWNTLAALEERALLGAATTLGLALATALAAGCYGCAGGAMLAQLVGALALSLGACALLGLWRRAPGLGARGVAPYVLLHYGLLWAARWAYELSTAGFVLLSLAPLCALSPQLVPVQRRRTRAACVVLGPTLCAATALILESRAAPPASYY